MVTDLGKDVDGFNLGDRVAYVGLPIGAYSEQRNYPANWLVKIPESISNELGSCIYAQRPNSLVFGQQELSN